MIVYAVYIVTDDGRTVLAEHFQSTDDLPDELLVGAFFSSLRIMAAEMTKKRSEIKSVQIEGFAYHIRSYGLFQVILVSDDPQAPENLIQTLGYRFMREYGEGLLDNWSLLGTFIPFKTVLHEVIQNESETIIDNSRSILPEKQLEPNEIFTLPHHLQTTALAILSLQEGTIKEIAEESRSDASRTETNLVSLREMGFIGIKETSGTRKYFCSIEF
ncbi:MAG: hypothetical protein ACE5OZ_17990 [Candidatus Heimdallarchaeota archaeon]